jgi:hypothetical protein
MQLGAGELQGDSTILALNPSLVSWSVLSGPIASISSTGVATAGNLHQNTAATVQGTYQGLSGTLPLTVIPVPGLTETYSQWIGLSFSPQQLSTNPALGNQTANPGGDGVTNLLKYLYDINPGTHLGNTDRLGLPVVSLVTVSNVEYLILTYRQSTLTTGITVNVQTTTDLKSWMTVSPPDFVQSGGTDPNTGDPIIEVGVKATSLKEQFIRLNVTQP